MLRQLCMTLGGVWLAAALVGCAAPPTTITTDPPGAFISIDGVGAGSTPLNHTFDFGKQAVYQVTAAKPGFFDTNVTLSPDSPAISNGVLPLGLQHDEAYEQTTTTEATNRWLRIQVSPDIKWEDAWQKIVDAVTGRYSSLEQLDNASGYLRSVPIARAFKHPIYGQYTIRTQFLGAVSSRTPLVYKIKITAEQSTPNGQWIPYERVFKDDAQLVDELQTRLGSK